MVALTAALVSFLWSWRAPRSRFAAILTDDPSGDELKVHAKPIPPIGGIGIYLALVPLFVQVADVMVWLAASAALALGVLDDRWALTPRPRLAVEVLIGVALAASPAIESGWSFKLAVVGATVVLINAINLYDGLDGLVGGSLAVSAFGVGILAGSLIAYSLGAAMIGFLVFNWHPAKLFLGDGGAYLVAVVLVSAALHAETSDLAALLVMLGMAGVALIDLMVTLVRRMRAGVPLFLGDRSHLYDQLVDRGWSVPAVSSVSIVAQGGIVATALLSFVNGGAVTAAFVLTGTLLSVFAVAAALGFTSTHAVRQLR